MKRAVFLDRDGVINRAVVRDGKPYPPDSVAEMQLVDDAPSAIRRLHDAGYLLIVVTNQPDVARGKQSREEVEAIHDALRAQLPIDEFIACYHDNADECDCRKPRPGSLLDAAQRHEIDLAASHMIGDRWRDVEAGQRAGCTTYFIDYGYAEKQPAPPFVRVRSLSEAVDIITGNPGGTDAHRR